MEMAQIGIEVRRTEISRELAAMADASAMQSTKQDMGNLSHFLPHTELGRFAFATLSDTSQREVGYATDSSNADIQRFTEILAQLQPGRSPTHVELGSVFRIGKEHGMPFVLAIADDHEQTIGYIKGIFVPSPKTEADILRAGQRASLLAVLFVLITALIIYPVIRGLIVKLEMQATQLAYANFDTIKVLGSAVAKRDRDTDAHNYRVTVYSIRLAETVGLDETAIRSLIKGAFLHDVGKIAIRDSVLLKSGSLDQNEFAEMKSHVQQGLEILGNSEWLADAVQVVGCHHEKYDGSGYPNGLAGEAIPITARIFAVADVFDALTSRRPYRKAVTPGEAWEILHQGAGQHFDPALVTAFEPLVQSLFAAVNQQGTTLYQVLSEAARPYVINILKEQLGKSVDSVQKR
ncbi:hypothetical protein MIZ01_0565 [Sideroxyarcus emersonii]|uniref:HD-GYP domain-containing protein n=2 Tax=Sideroxyarcus emersonii TaxID=2764705 RepID=A0AAN2BY62_9PROT|nr:hypothetical protein MIZ01_0565 [Sideroxyarcus emersonii]